MLKVSKISCMATAVVLTLSCLTGCSNSSIADSPELAGNIAMTEYDTGLKLSKIATNVVASEGGFNSQLVTMVQPTTTVLDSDYTNLKSSLSTAHDTVSKNIISVDSFTCPETMTAKRDTLRTALVEYQQVLEYLMASCDEQDVGKVKVGYDNFKTAISNIQAAGASTT